MQIEIPYTPHAKQISVHNDPARFKVLNWGRRTGKSTLGINETLKRALLKQGRYWIVSPTYKQSKNIYWRGLVNQIPKQLIHKRNESELILELINGAFIELKGADQPDSLRGAGIEGVILDEYAFMKPDVWEEIIRPMLLDSKGWAIFISTPNGFNHFYDIVQAAIAKPNWAYYHATTYDNPYIDPKELEEERETYDPDTFAQEFLGEFKKMKGLVYSEFSREVHVVSPSQVPDDGMRYLGVDFGFVNPLAVLYVLVDYDNNWWVYDEIYERGLKTKQAVNIIKRKMNDQYFTGKVGDSAAAQEIANFADHGLHVDAVKKGKDSIKAGIQLIHNQLAILEATGKPKLFISANCTNLIWEFETYRYPEEKEDKNAPEEPIKEDDHAMDALRYIFLHFSQPSIRKRKVRKHKVYDPITGRLLS